MVDSTRSTFNGATALRPWKPSKYWHPRCRISILQWGHGSEAVETPIGAVYPCRKRTTFNGATALRPWKLKRLNLLIGAAKALQWGHGSEAVETTYEVDSTAWFHALQWGHGSEAVETA
ncbi:protein of unknown function [Candidatus Methylomirabilis oxygeniifera]|uniref:Uncharacterized protein n=1 Tax=Methylomirabilis oxygeniifera TaxID=671143 RepID=D5MKW3_METO1|nr:protein of unknown function [Candidatus Methylomirabilis oxyfera]